MDDIELSFLIDICVQDISLRLNYTIKLLQNIIHIGLNRKNKLPCFNMYPTKIRLIYLHGLIVG